MKRMGSEYTWEKLLKRTLPVRVAFFDTLAPLIPDPVVGPTGPTGGGNTGTGTSGNTGGSGNQPQVTIIDAYLLGNVYQDPLEISTYVDMVTTTNTIITAQTSDGDVVNVQVFYQGATYPNDYPEFGYFGGQYSTTIRYNILGIYYPPLLNLPTQYKIVRPSSLQASEYTTLSFIRTDLNGGTFPGIGPQPERVIVRNLNFPVWSRSNDGSRYLIVGFYDEPPAVSYLLEYRPWVDGNTLYRMLDDNLNYVTYSNGNPIFVVSSTAPPFSISGQMKNSESVIYYDTRQYYIPPDSSSYRIEYDANPTNNEYNLYSFSNESQNEIVTVTYVDQFPTLGVDSSGTYYYIKGFYYSSAPSGGSEPSTSPPSETTQTIPAQFVDPAIPSSTTTTTSTIPEITIPSYSGATGPISYTGVPSSLIPLSTGPSAPAVVFPERRLKYVPSESKYEIVNNSGVSYYTAPYIFYFNYAGVQFPYNISVPNSDSEIEDNITFTLIGFFPDTFQAIPTDFVGKANVLSVGAGALGDNIIGVSDSNTFYRKLPTTTILNKGLREYNDIFFNGRQWIAVGRDTFRTEAFIGQKRENTYNSEFSVLDIYDNIDKLVSQKYDLESVLANNILINASEDTIQNTTNAIATRTEQIGYWTDILEAYRANRDALALTDTSTLLTNPVYRFSKVLGYSYDGVNWEFEKRNPFSIRTYVPANYVVSNSIEGRCVTWDGNMWLIGGRGTANIATSTDGQTWLSFRNPWLAVINGAAGNGTMWVTTGIASNPNSSSAVSIATSTNGYTWIPSNRYLTEGKHALWTGKAFVVVGVAGSGGNVLLTSSDGIFWYPRVTSSELGGSAGYRRVRCSDKTIIAVADGLQKIARSTDGGYTWSHVSLNFIPRDVVWDGLRWVANTSGNVFYASLNDGQTWTVIESQALTSGNSIFSNKVLLLDSADSLASYLAVGSGSTTSQRSIAGTSYINLTLTRPLNNSTFYLNTLSSSYNKKSVVWTGSEWLIVGGNEELIHSPNGLDFKFNRLVYTVNSSTFQCLTLINAIGKNPTLYLATGTKFSNQSAIWTSPDKSTWTSRTNSLTSGNCVSWNGSYWLVGGNTVVTSPDAITWTTRTTGLTLIKTAVWNGLFWVLGGTGSEHSIALSNNGSFWTTANTSSIPLSTVNGIAWNKSLYVAVGSGTSHTIATSTDGYTWTGRGKTSITSEGLSIAWDETRWTAGGTNSQLFTSTDGITWTSVTTSLTTVDGISSNKITLPYSGSSSHTVHARLIETYSRIEDDQTTLNAINGAIASEATQRTTILRNAQLQKVKLLHYQKYASDIADAINLNTLLPFMTQEYSVLYQLVTGMKQLAVETLLDVNDLIAELNALNIVNTTTTINTYTALLASLAATRATMAAKLLLVQAEVAGYVDPIINLVEETQEFITDVGEKHLADITALTVGTKIGLIYSSSNLTTIQGLVNSQISSIQTILDSSPVTTEVTSISYAFNDSSTPDIFTSSLSSLAQFITSNEPNLVTTIQNINSAGPAAFTILDNLVKIINYKIESDALIATSIAVETKWKQMGNQSTTNVSSTVTTAFSTDYNAITNFLASLTSGFSTVNSNVAGMLTKRNLIKTRADSYYDVVGHNEDIDNIYTHMYSLVFTVPASVTSALTYSKLKLNTVVKPSQNLVFSMFQGFRNAEVSNLSLNFQTQQYIYDLSNTIYWKDSVMITGYFFQWMLRFLYAHWPTIVQLEADIVEAQLYAQSVGSRPPVGGWGVQPTPTNQGSPATQVVTGGSWFPFNRVYDLRAQLLNYIRTFDFNTSTINQAYQTSEKLKFMRDITYQKIVTQYDIIVTRLTELNASQTLTTAHIDSIIQADVNSLTSIARTAYPFWHTQALNTLTNTFIPSQQDIEDFGASVLSSGETLSQFFGTLSTNYTAFVAASTLNVSTKTITELNALMTTSRNSYEALSETGQNLVGFGETLAKYKADEVFLNNLKTKFQDLVNRWIAMKEKSKYYPSLNVFPYDGEGENFIVSIPPTDSRYWLQLTDVTKDYRFYSNTETYEINDEVLYDLTVPDPRNPSISRVCRLVFRCISNLPNDPILQGIVPGSVFWELVGPISEFSASYIQQVTTVYNATTQYQPNAEVTYEGSIYKVLAATPGNLPPDFVGWIHINDLTYETELDLPIYDNNWLYYEGDKLSYNGLVYKCVNTVPNLDFVVNIIFTNTEYWDTYSPGDSDDPYNYPLFSYSKKYEIGDIVRSTGTTLYKCKKVFDNREISEITNIIPTNTIYWEAGQNPTMDERNIPDWNGLATYTRDALVNWNGNIFRCHIPPSPFVTGTDLQIMLLRSPDKNIDNWKLITDYTEIGLPALYNSSTIYRIGDVVTYKIPLRTPSSEFDLRVYRVKLLDPVVPVQYLYPEIVVDTYDANTRNITYKHINRTSTEDNVPRYGIGEEDPFGLNGFARSTRCHIAMKYENTFKAIVKLAETYMSAIQEKPGYTALNTYKIHTRTTRKKNALEVWNSFVNTMNQSYNLFLSTAVSFNQGVPLVDTLFYQSALERPLLTLFEYIKDIAQDAIILHREINVIKTQYFEIITERVFRNPYKYINTVQDTSNMSDLTKVKFRDLGVGDPEEGFDTDFERTYYEEKTAIIEEKQQRIARIVHYIRDLIGRTLLEIMLTTRVRTAGGYILSDSHESTGYRRLWVPFTLYLEEGISSGVSAVRIYSENPLDDIYVGDFEKILETISGATAIPPAYTMSTDLSGPLTYETKNPLLNVLGNIATGLVGITASAFKTAIDPYGLIDLVDGIAVISGLDPPFEVFPRIKWPTFIENLESRNRMYTLIAQANIEYITRPRPTPVDTSTLVRNRNDLEKLKQKLEYYEDQFSKQPKPKPPSRPTATVVKPGEIPKKASLTLTNVPYENTPASVMSEIKSAKLRVIDNINKIQADIDIRQGKINNLRKPNIITETRVVVSRTSGAGVTHDVKGFDRIAAGQGTTHVEGSASKYTYDSQGNKIDRITEIVTTEVVTREVERVNSIEERAEIAKNQQEIDKFKADIDAAKATVPDIETKINAAIAADKAAIDKAINENARLRQEFKNAEIERFQAEKTFKAEAERVSKLNASATDKFSADFKKFHADRVSYNASKVKFDSVINNLKAQIEIKNTEIINRLKINAAIAADLSDNSIPFRLTRVRTIYRKLLRRITENLVNERVVTVINRLKPTIKRIKARIPRSVKIHGAAAVGATLHIASIAFGALMDGSFGIEPVNAVNAGMQSISKK